MHKKHNRTMIMLMTTPEYFCLMVVLMETKLQVMEATVKNSVNSSKKSNKLGEISKKN